MLNEPGVSQYDLQFHLFGFPIRIAWGFWIVAAILGWSWSGSLDSLGAIAEYDSPGAPVFLLIWISALLVSISVHELGHSIAMRYYGIGSRIVLYHFGGLAIPDSFGAWNGARQRRVGPREQIVISAAGPVFQLLLALLVWGIGLSVGMPMELNGWINNALGTEIGATTLPNSLITYGMFDAILYPSTAWAILNLVPILPLDGGQILRSTLLLFNVRDAVRIAQGVSIVAGGLIGLYFIQNSQPFGVMFLFMAASNWQAMQMGSGGY